MPLLACCHSVGIAMSQAYVEVLFLRIHLVLPGWILVAWPVEIDDVSRARTLKDRMLAIESIFIDRRELDVTVAPRNQLGP